MIEQLLQALTGAWDKVAPYFVVPCNEQAGVLRFGVYHRTKGPGFHLKIPLVDDVRYATTVTTVARLPPQTCTTADNESVVVCGVVRYRVSDIEAHLANVYEPLEVLEAACAVLVLRAVREHTFAQLVNAPPHISVAKELKRDMKQYGVTVEKMGFTDIGRVRSLRLIQAAKPIEPVL